MTVSQNTSTAARRRTLAACLALTAATGVAAVGAAGAAAAVPHINFTTTPNPVAIGDSLTASLAGSYDADGPIVEWEYDLNGDGVYERRVHTTTNRSFTIAIGGPPRNQLMRARVTDAQGNKVVSARLVKIHTRPVALLTADRPVPTVGEVVGYRATGSYDPDPGGYIRNYSWDLDGNGTFERSTGTSPYVQTSFGTPGNSRIAVRVTDGDGATASRQLIVRVNGRPSAVIAATPNPAVAGQPVTLSGSNSQDDRGIVRYAWDLDGNGSYETDGGTSPTTTTTFATPGTRKVALRVTDTDGATDESAVQLAVTAAPQRDTTAPKVTLTPSRVRAANGRRTVTFTVGCPADELFCRTSIRLVGRGGSLAGRSLATTRSAVVPGGERQRVTLRLGSRARTALRHKKRIAATARITARDAAGNAATSTRRVTIVR